MATAPTVPDFSQYNFELGDTTQVVTKQNGQNAALVQFGNSLTAMTDSINQDLSVMEGLKTNTETAATSASQDAQQTGEDRAATGQDATATAADRVQTGEDRNATGQDATATAADRVQTGEDRTAAAGSAQAASDDATAAEQAKNGAENLYGDLQAVEAAKTAADQAAADAGTERQGAETARQGAEDAQTAAEQAASTSEQAAQDAVDAHEAKVDPHEQYVPKVAGKQLSTEDYTSAEKTKLAGIEAEATANSSDATLLDRANHTGTQPLATISDAGSAASQDASAFDPAGSASSAVQSHEEAADPHEQYYNASRLTIWSRDKEREALEAATGGACTIERTPSGQACHMFVLPRTTWGDLVPSGELGTGTHEAFIENGDERSELLVGMYMAAEINGEMVSQPRTTGRRSINWGQSVDAAQAVGMQLFGNWEWSAIAFWCMANGFQPRGNTDFGVSHSHPHERGVYDDDSVSNEYTLLGSGPNTWSHNAAANGIADLVGNRWEWVWGFKMVDGRIFLAPDNDRSATESSWVDTGWDMPSATSTNWSGLSTSATQDIQRALIMPNGVADPDGSMWTNLSGERFPGRGGSRGSGASAGLGALLLSPTRAHSNPSFGLRLSRLV